MTVPNCERFPTRILHDGCRWHIPGLHWVAGSIPARCKCLVKPIILICLGLTILGCAARNGVDNRNFAVDTYVPTPNEIQRAEGRARNWWARNGARFGPEPSYLAVETSKVFGPYPGLYPKLIDSETTASFFAHGKRMSYSNLVLKGVMIFDTQTGRFVGERGYIAVDTPIPGGVARLGDHIARWIGTGRL